MPDDEHDGQGQASHLRKLLEKRLHQLALSAHFAESENSALALHDLRVAARRLRAVGDVLRGLLGAKVHAKIDKPLKHVLRDVADVRDRDVQIALTLGRREGSPTDFERATLEYLLERLEDARGVAAGRAKKKLKKTDFEALRSFLRANFEDALEAFPKRAASQRLFARELLEELIERAVAIRPAGGETEPKDAHHLRIAVKKLRYALEIFEPSLGESYAWLAERATTLQDLLGDHHDRVVFGDFVAEVARELEAKQRSALAAGTNSVRASLEREREDLEARLGKDGFDAATWRAQVRLGTTTD